MSTEVEEKLLDFVHRLFTIASIDPSAIEALKGNEMVVEIQFADCPKANFQVEAHQDKLTVYKGTPKEPTIVMIYAGVQILKYCLEGRMSYLHALLMSRDLVANLGGNDEVVFFLEQMERPLRIAWMSLRNEFPGLPSKDQAPQAAKSKKKRKKSS